MTDYHSYTQDQLLGIKVELEAEISRVKSLALKLDMTRGKPSPAQLNLSLPLLSCVGGDDYIAQDGSDCRNYGGLDGLPEAKELFAAYLEVNKDQIIIGGNASLNTMHDAVSISMLHGTTSGEPWIRQPKVKFLAPVPGYDRHFSICEHLGIEMIPVGMDEHGPDMDKIEELVLNDASIKGIWCVPKYSNPTGVCYSDEVIERLASLNAKAPDFRIFWDNAYNVHHHGEGVDTIKNILSECAKAGHPDRVYIFSSTSKMTFPGAGIAMMAGSENNMAFFRKHLAAQTIGPDKLNQLRHVRFFKDLQGLYQHMDEHAKLLGERFNAVDDVLTTMLSGKGIARWITPKGGYFISLETICCSAKKVIDMADELGVKLTPAGSTWPYMNDIHDNDIRIAPSFPKVTDVSQASKVLCLCIEYLTIENLIEKSS